MTEVEFSRKTAVLVAYLNQSAIKRLFSAIAKSNSFNTLQEPYKTWVTDPSVVPVRDLRENARLALPIIDTVSGKALDISQIRVEWIEE